MSSYFSQHVLYQKALNDRHKVLESTYNQHKKDLKNYLDKFNNAKILEIGCGMGKFAYFCNKIGVQDYTGIDIDDYFFDENKKDFPEYNFKKIGFQEYLRNHKNEFDIVFVSHVFEHLDEKERVEMIETIYGGLKKNGIRINYMPNADGFLRFGMSRYGDLTHKCIYNNVSFDQLIKSTELPFDIKNYNIYIGIKNKFRRAIHLVFLFFTKIYFLGMGEIFPEFYSWQFINILTKKGKN